MSETLSDIGEFGLICRIRQLLEKEKIQSPRVTLGIGDDAASFCPRPECELLVTCDCLVENRHFLPDHIDPLDLGRRAMTINISDIGAMGGKPLYALVSLGLKAETQVKDVEAMYRGFLIELKPFGASIIGGNITKMENTDFIDITLIGEVEQGRVMRRSTAQAGDVILVTGYPGQAAAGLQLLLLSDNTDDVKAHPLVHAYNVPKHRAWEGQAVARSGYARAMIDTSDGFLGDLSHICQESNVGAVLIQEKLPISEDLRQTASRLKLDPLELFLQESDDYGLIITCSPENLTQLRSAIAEVSDVPVTEVGKITDAAEGIILILPDGRKRRLKETGWNHFAR